VAKYSVDTIAGLDYWTHPTACSVQTEANRGQRSRAFYMEAAGWLVVFFMLGFLASGGCAWAMGELNILSCMHTH